jgi:hypothetical protein
MIYLIISLKLDNFIYKIMQLVWNGQLCYLARLDILIPLLAIWEM